MKEGGMSFNVSIARYDTECSSLAVLPVIVARWLMPGVYIIKPAANKELKMDTKSSGSTQRGPEPVITDKSDCRVRYFFADTLFCL
jgi:hypothetical protein